MQDQQGIEAGEVVASAAPAAQKRKRVPDRFGVNQWLLGLWVVCILAMMGVAIGRNGADAKRVADLSTGITINFLFMMFIAWVGFLVTGRRRMGANIGFGLGLILSAWLVSFAVIQSRRATQASADANKAIAEFRESSRSGDTDAALAAGGRAADAIDDLAKSSTGAKGKLLAMQAEWMRGMQGSLGEWNLKVRAFLAAGGVDPVTMKSPELVDSRIAMIGELRSAHRAVMERFHEVDGFEARLVELGVSASAARAEMTVFRRSADLESVKRLRSMDLESIDAYEMIAQIFKKHLGTIVWRDASEGGFLFGPDVPEEDVAGYTAAVERVREIDAKQTELQRQIQEASDRRSSKP